MKGVELLLKFFDKLHDVLYDFFGFVIPGFIVLGLCYISILSSSKGNFVSPAGGIIECFKSWDFSALTFDWKLSAVQSTILFFAAYILGHVFNVIARQAIRISRKLLDKIETSKEKEDPAYSKLVSFVKSYHSSNYTHRMIMNNARSIDRANNGQSNIQKYISKCNFHATCVVINIFFIIDTVFQYSGGSFLLVTSILTISLVLLSIFLSEYCRHRFLCFKESYMILYREILKNKKLDDSIKKEKELYPL